MRPFSTGSQFMDWQCGNCYRCKLFNADNINLSACDLDKALGDALWDDGEITPEIAKRIGYNQYAYTWDCPEKIKVDE